MIARIQTIEEIVPIFTQYLGCVGKFYEIYDFNAWCGTALKNLKRDFLSADQQIYGLTKSGDIIGFAQVNKHLRFNKDGVAIAEFYIGKDHARRGWGRKLAEHVFAQYSGNWEVAVSANNGGGLLFWQQVICAYTSGKYMEKKHVVFKGNGFLFNNKEMLR
jgi:predicted acetyltransferase